jgi:heterodisulfide reductase subunit A
MKKIGVFICWCGSNIASRVDVKAVAEEIGRYPGIAHAEDYVYMCSDPGQNLVKETIRKKELDGVIVACCSPTLHENTFRRAASSVGLNPFQLEIANIREQCSWVHSDNEKATEKATEIIKSMIEKVRENESLKEISIPVTRRALVVGGGIAGMQAALDIADNGYEVVLVERYPSIGGHMIQLSETFPTLDCSQCIMTPKMVEVAQHPNIKLMTYSELEEISGYVGNFKAKIRRKAAYVDWEKCTGCGLCMEKCPSKVPAEFERGLGKRKAIYIPFPQAVPYRPVIDRENCIYFKKGKCGLCKKLCGVDAVDYEQEDRIIEEEVGAIVVATGYDLLPLEEVTEYGYGSIPDVIDGLAFERMLSASGPTAGAVKRPSDGKEPKEVVFIQCVRSRDPERGFAYCSKICCMYTAKHAMLYKHKVHDGQTYIFYIDIRSNGKGYEEFVQRAMEEDDVLYLRGRVSKVFQEGDKVAVWGVDTLTGKRVEILADLVVLAVPVRPSEGYKELAQKIKIGMDPYGFFNEAHPKLRPVETLTRGIFLAGCGQAPKDIPETVAQASGAASKVCALFSEEQLHHDPTVAWVDPELCSGCGICVAFCPYDAREMDEERNIARVIDVLCQGCGGCVAACPNNACQHVNTSNRQVLQMIDAFL